MLSPPLNDTLIHYQQALLDVLITYPIESASSRFSADINFGGLGINTTTVMTFVSIDDVSRLYQFKGSPGLVELDPSWLNAFSRFVSSGVEHIFIGIDHLLFILCLILPCRRIRSLIIVITAFTVAHSITLIASALGTVPSGLWFPPFVETFIAFSILYMALENILNSEHERRWPLVFAFGLLHGFGFSFALSETMQFAGSHLITSLLAFNLGVELGQILIVCLIVPIINLIFQWSKKERIITVIVSVLVAHTAWHWMFDRYEVMQAYNFSGFLDHSGSSIINWVIVSFVVVLVYLILRRLFNQIME
jgi:hydrogenase/urease accessory protein HupE